MNLRNGNSKNTESVKWQLTSATVTRYNILFGMLTMIVVTIASMALILTSMANIVEKTMQGTRYHASEILGQTHSILSSLAMMPEFADNAVPIEEKLEKLDLIGQQFDYFLMCYVDSDFMVYAKNQPQVSLASRDYLQRLFATGQHQITDSLPAWSDGHTLAYAVAVPILNEQGTVKGALLASIEFDEMTEILRQGHFTDATGMMLVGGRGQIMSSYPTRPYGASAIDAFCEARLFGTTADDIEERMLSGDGGNFWSIHNGDVFCAVYQNMPNTRWNLFCSVSLRAMLRKFLPGYLMVFVVVTLACAVTVTLVKINMARQMETVYMLVSSVEALEKRIYLEEHPEEHDFNEIIQLTSKGITDGLTGTVTRTVFLNQAKTLLKRANPEHISALCFVDLDNLKYINDNFGHLGGDLALKSVGYILREYEKRFGGVVGRYGGDEFVLLLMNLDNISELTEIMDELSLRMHHDVTSGSDRIPVRCSIGVSVFYHDSTVEQLIAEADEALYFVKQNGKGYYKIYESGRVYEV